MPVTIDGTISEPQIARWLGDRSFAEWQAEYDEQGFTIIENVLDPEMLQRIRDALQPHFDKQLKGRNNFEGLLTNRVYALVAKDPVFAELITHPLALAFVDAELGRAALLSAALAINLHPGESVQPWHHDDNHLRVPRPRAPFGVSTFWAIDAMTENNGATELIPKSHHWDDQLIDGANRGADFGDDVVRDPFDDPNARGDAIKALMPAGSFMVAKGTLWHRGGANRSDQPRLIVTPQYCPGWARQLENMVLTMSPGQAAALPERARELMGYSIHPPFMGYVDGMHPQRVLAKTND